MWGINLDRFSQPLSSEREPFNDGQIIYEVEEVIVCKGCNQVLCEDDKTVQSEYWEDDYLHDDSQCIARYYQKENERHSTNSERHFIKECDVMYFAHEKDPFAANKKVG